MNTVTRYHLLLDGYLPPDTTKPASSVETGKWGYRAALSVRLRPHTYGPPSQTRIDFQGSNPFHRHRRYCFRLAALGLRVLCSHEFDERLILEVVGPELTTQVAFDAPDDVLLRRA